MAPPSLVFYLYQLREHEDPRHLLLRVERPDYVNASQAHEDWAYQQEEAQRDALLSAYLATLPFEPEITLLGVCEGAPPGDALYEDGPLTVQLWVAPTRYGPPWVQLGLADSEDAFFAELEDDSLTAGTSQRPALQVEALLVTSPPLPLHEPGGAGRL